YRRHHRSTVVLLGTLPGPVNRYDLHSSAVIIKGNGRNGSIERPCRSSSSTCEHDVKHCVQFDSVWSHASLAVQEIKHADAFDLYRSIRGLEACGWCKSGVKF